MIHRRRGLCGHSVCLHLSLESSGIASQGRDRQAKLVNKIRRQMDNGEGRNKDLADTADLVRARAVVGDLAVIGDALLQVGVSALDG